MEGSAAELQLASVKHSLLIGSRLRSPSPSKVSLGMLGTLVLLREADSHYWNLPCPIIASLLAGATHAAGLHAIACHTLLGASFWASRTSWITRTAGLEAGSDLLEIKISPMIELAMPLPTKTELLMSLKQLQV